MKKIKGYEYFRKALYIYIYIYIYIYYIYIIYIIFLLLMNDIIIALYYLVMVATNFSLTLT